MAYTIEQATERNVDTPLTNFPVGEDFFDRMTDITSTLMPLINKYNSYFQAGNITACNELLKNNPDLANCFFNADKYNQIRDAIIAMERFYLNDVAKIIELTAQNAIGINDSPTDEQASLVTYSANKIRSLHKKREIKLLASGWSDTYPHEQTVSLAGITADMDLKIIGVVHEDGNTLAEDKLIDKTAGYLLSSSSGVIDNAAIFKAKKKPTIDITIITEGG